MIQYVIAHPLAIGMIGANWLNDNKERVKVLGLLDPNAPDSSGTGREYFKPHQAYIYRGSYPITRDVYIYSRADNYGVGAGFISFVTSAPGQKIVLNSGLVPATMPVRLVELTNKGVQR
jgi:phosphate transport system substrate-binding protein